MLEFGIGRKGEGSEWRTFREWRGLGHHKGEESQKDAEEERWLQLATVVCFIDMMEIELIARRRQAGVERTVPTLKFRMGIHQVL